MAGSSNAIFNKDYRCIGFYTILCVRILSAFRNKCNFSNLEVHITSTRRSDHRQSTSSFVGLPKEVGNFLAIWANISLSWSTSRFEVRSLKLSVLILAGFLRQPTQLPLFDLRKYLDVRLSSYCRTHVTKRPMWPCMLAKRWVAFTSLSYLLTISRCFNTSPTPSDYSLQWQERFVDHNTAGGLDVKSDVCFWLKFTNP